MFTPELWFSSIPSNTTYIEKHLRPFRGWETNITNYDSKFMKIKTCSSMKLLCSPSRTAGRAKCLWNACSLTILHPFWCCNTNNNSAFPAPQLWQTANELLLLLLLMLLQVAMSWVFNNFIVTAACSNTKRNFPTLIGFIIAANGCQLPVSFISV